jgi:hypothetical protein
MDVELGQFLYRRPAEIASFGFVLPMDFGASKVVVDLCNPIIRWLRARPGTIESRCRPERAGFSGDSLDDIIVG